jgi:hypothetical protein
MQALNENRSMVYAMFFVNPTQTSEVTSDYAVTLRRIREAAHLIGCDEPSWTWPLVV